MGIYTALFVTPVLIVGVLVGSPAILGVIGLSAAGPIAGGAFATMQGAGIASGTWMAVAQTIAMTATALTP